jgi:hypothetical protein
MTDEPKITLRFVRNKGWKYSVVAWRGLIAMPFTPTHVEAVTKAGTCLGQHSEGMKEFPLGYDRGNVWVLADGRPAELFVDLPATQAQVDLFYDFMYAAVAAHEPYDWSAPWTFLVGGHHHKRFASMCSPKVFLGLRHCGWFKWPVTLPAHEIDPSTLMLILSTHVEIPH